MHNTTKRALMVAGFALVTCSTTSAQTLTRGLVYVEVNGGAQTQSQTLTTSTSFPLYGETAAINSAQTVDGGGLFDISAGYRIIPNVGVGVGFSTFSKDGDGTIVASIPSPAAFNKSVTSTTSTSTLVHKESGVHLMAAWSMPLIPKLDVTVFAGPSFIRLTQDVLTASVLAGTQTASVATKSEKARTKGVNAGVSFSYMVAPNYGAGVFLRYAGGTADLPSLADVKVGGLQLGGGLRLRF